MAQVEPLKLMPEYHERVWGGTRLMPDADEPIGEAWVVYEGNVVSGGTWDGATLEAVAADLGSELLGSRAAEMTGNRFPLLVKLLDSRDWLSVQVHPNDRQALELEGPNQFGKTEAWYVLDAEPGARLISGLTGDLTPDLLRRAIEGGTLERYLNHVDVQTGDAIFTPAGQVHAIGPGLFIYEVQQTSDITYRLFDWNRPASQGRELHLDKGTAVAAPGDPEAGKPVTTRTSDGAETLVECPYFALDSVTHGSGRVQLRTEGISFHALTVAEGDVTLRSDSGDFSLGPLDSIVVPAATLEYELVSALPYRILRARVA